MKPISRCENNLDSYELNLDFKEVDPKILAPHEWHECFAMYMQHAEHITLLEGRGVVAALRRKLRGTVEHGKKHLHLSDNMALKLLISKGRSGAFGLLKICRRLAALLLATDSFLAVRWMPSELNIADGPSRRWEHLRASHVESRSKEKAIQKQIDEECYGSGPCQLRSPYAVASPRNDAKQDPKEERNRSRLPPDHRGEASATASEAAGEDGGSAVSGSDPPGDSCGFQAGCNRLSATGSKVEAFCKDQLLQTLSEEQVRHGLL